MDRMPVVELSKIFKCLHLSSSKTNNSFILLYSKHIDQQINLKLDKFCKISAHKSN